ADVPVIVGGVLAGPEILPIRETETRGSTGISLTPDPALLFARLKFFFPHTRRVLVVYSAQRNEWLIRLAREAARSHGLELIALEASDLGSAVRHYAHAFAAADGRRDAVWLLQDAATLDENTILPLVLRESWNRNVPVFSSSFQHVKKGVLFALYPDNIQLGRSLAASAEQALSGDARRGVLLPLRDVHLAVNLRTAGHLGLRFSRQQQRSFDMVFPEP
ncbi:MAG TPA: ABC transporter substrate binding protein, partial [Noviherbaspirillum sp.]|nr:ABC transporter substrate binding protein [Noviherbaspirillum sp.]